MKNGVAEGVGSDPHDTNYIVTQCSKLVCWQEWPKMKKCINATIAMARLRYEIEFWNYPKNFTTVNTKDSSQY